MVLRAVLDANVYISAILRPEGPPGQILERFLRRGDFAIVVSPSIAEEVLRALAYPKLQKHLRGSHEASLWFEDILVLAELVPEADDQPNACDDPDDNKYFAAASEGRASFVVTGDHGFLTLREYAGARIVTPRAFLGLLGS